MVGLIVCAALWLIAAGIALALISPALSGWTVIAAVLICTGFGLLARISHLHRY